MSKEEITKLKEEFLSEIKNLEKAFKSPSKYKIKRIK